MRPLARTKPVQKTAPPPANLDAAVQRFNLGAEQLLAERLSLPRSAEARLEVILCEIDETVLPRRITLHDGSAIVAVLTASNRRLCAVEVSDAETAVALGEALNAATFAKKLQFTAEHVSRISTAPCTENATETETHLTVGALRKVLNKNVQPAVFADLKRSLSQNALAQLKWQSHSEPAFEGDIKWQSFLNSQSAALRDFLMSGHDPDTSKEPFVKACAVPLCSSSILVVCCTHSEGFAVICDYSQGLEKVQHWQSNDPT